MIPTIHIPNTGHPWSTVYAVAAADMSESWLLTGGSWSHCTPSWAD